MICALGARLVASARTAEILRAGGHQVWYEFPDEVVATEVDVTVADGEVLRLPAHLRSSRVSVSWLSLAHVPAIQDVVRGSECCLGGEQYRH